MSHSFVVAQFNPAQSAYWLSPSGRLTASKLATRPFWAVRFDFRDHFDKNPRMLCAVSSLPSFLAIPDASLTLGPQLAIESGVLWAPDEGTQLVVQPPLYCYEETAPQTLYLHTAPRMIIGYGSIGPPEVSLYQLEDDSLSQFKETAKKNQQIVCDDWAARRRAFLVGRLPHPPDMDPGDVLESIFSGPADPTYIFGERNSPHAYDFNFLYPDLPFCDYPTLVYDEIIIYAHHSNKHLRPLGYISRTDEVDVQESLKQDAVFLSNAKALSRIDFDPPGDSDSESEPESADKTSDKVDGVDADTTDEDDFIWAHWLPFAFPLLPRVYHRVPLPHTPKIIILDVFGVLLDREGAIHDALERWLPLARRPRDIAEAVRLYIEVEALAARKLHASATSLGTIVHCALDALISKLGLPSSWRSVFLADAAAIILSPRPYEDVELAVDALVRQGCAVVGLIPFSSSTFDTLRPMVPPLILAALELYPVAIPVHFPVSDADFFPALMQWSRHTLNRPDLSTQEVLITSGSVGRLLAPAAANGHPTVLVQRPEGIECNVEFIVGEDQKTPSPSAVCGTLEELGSLITNALLLE